MRNGEKTMKKSKRILGALMALAMLLTAAPAYAAQQTNPQNYPGVESSATVLRSISLYADNDTSFTDVPSGAYYAEAVAWAVENGVTNGTSATTFSPGATVTRAEAVAFLWRAAGKPEPKSTVSPFSDVTDKSAYYYKAVLWAAEQNITNGMGGGKFGLRSTLAYDQILTFLCRASGETAAGTDWSAAAVEWAAKNGLTAGLTFSPKDSCPRADVIYCLWMQLTAQNSPSQIDEQSVYNTIIALKAQYPEGMHWTNDNKYYSAALHITGYGCAGFAFLCSDAAFGDLPGRQHEDFDAIRVGDIIRIGNYHSVVVLEKRANSVIVTEGNYNSSIHWGREITRSSLESEGFYVTTRYPQA